jgi:hypothetical protein
MKFQAGITAVALAALASLTSAAPTLAPRDGYVALYGDGNSWPGVDAWTDFDTM